MSFPHSMLCIVLLLALTPFVLSSEVRYVSATVQPTILQMKTWGGSQNDQAQKVIVDSAGNIYVSGITYSYGPGSPSCPSLFVVKYTPLGAIVWQKIWYNGSSFYGNLNPPAMAVDSSGSIYLAGGIYSGCGGGFVNGFVIKLDSSGNVAWQKYYANPLYVLPFNGVAVDSLGHVYVTGNAYIYGHSQVLLLRLAASDGTLQFQKTWGGSNYEYGYGVATDASGNVYVAAQTGSFGACCQNAALVGFDSSGNWRFNKIVGNGNEEAVAVALDSTGNIYLVGSTYSHPGGHVLIEKFDSSSGPVWQRSYGGSNGTDSGNGGIAVDSAGNLAIAGVTTSYGSGGSACGGTCFSAYLAKIDSGGSQVLSSVVLGKYNTNTRADGGVACDSLAHCFIAGTVSSAPPYFTTQGNTTLGMPVLSITSTGNSTLGTPNFPVKNIPNSGSLNVSGSQTYAGMMDSFFIEYGLYPQVTFATNPTSGGSINFNGTSYTNGQNGNFTIGNATATATASAGSHFTSWTTTGGVSVANPAANPTTVIVAGAGSLKANFAANAPVTPITLLIGALIVAPILHARRRKLRVE